jgi:hypothetical protein
MAKRSVRRERAREQHGTPKQSPSRPPAPAESHGTLRSRQFWLGVLAAACLLVPAAVLAVVLVSGGDSNGAAATSSATVTPSPSEEAKKLEQADADRDKTQVAQLTELMRQYAEDLDPVVLGVNKTLPPEQTNKVGPLAPAREVDEWIDATTKAEKAFDESVSGGTDTNVARGAFATAVRGLARMVETYKLAVDQPATRRELLNSVRAQRDDAMRAWETAGIQVDVININAGFGHQHPPRPGGLGVAPDELPEGTDATGG